jgi:putative glutamine amidotransferase
MKRPVIGIEADVDRTPRGTRFAKVYEQYYQQVADAGGNPVLLPPLDGPEHVERALEVADAIVVTGGDDLPAQDYGEETLTCERTSHVDGVRYRFGRELIRAAIRVDRPLLGVCYGHQLLNVALGGALVQDLPIQLGLEGHRVPEGDVHHEIELDAGSRLAKLLGLVRGRVNSRHHQSVKRAGEGLEVVAKAPDGVIEAVEMPGRRFVFGVQWHPERMGAETMGIGLFRALIEAAGSTSH